MAHNPKTTVLSPHAYAVLNGRGFELVCHSQICPDPKLQVGDEYTRTGKNGNPKYWHAKCFEDAHV